jgi:hypothetical protein
VRTCPRSAPAWASCLTRKLLDEWIGPDSLDVGLDWVGCFQNAFGLDWTRAFLNVDLF